MLATWCLSQLFLEAFILASADAVFNPEQTGSIADSSPSCDVVLYNGTPNFQWTQTLTKRGVDLTDHKSDLFVADVKDGDFSRFVAESAFYVDKSLLIAGLFKPTLKQVVIITAPRRWGKTINLSMLKFFCEIAVDASNGDELDDSRQANRMYFTEGRILQNGEKVDHLPLISTQTEVIDKHLGKHHVICLNGGILDMTDGLLSFRTMIYKTYRKHLYLQRKLSLLSTNASIAVLDRYEAAEDLRLMELYIVWEKVQLQAISQLAMSISRLSQLLWKWYGEKKVIILYDEYDSFIQKRYFSSDITAHPENERIFRRCLTNFMYQTFKNNEYLYKGIITGILSVAERAYQPNLNCADFCYIFGDMDLFPFYGIFDYEFNEMLEKRKVEKRLANLAKIFYGGYHTVGHPNSRMYSTYSAIGFITYLQTKNFWKESSLPVFLNGLLKQDQFLIDFIQFMSSGQNDGNQPPLKILYGKFHKLTQEDCEMIQQLVFGITKYKSNEHTDIVFSALIMLGFGTVSEDNRPPIANSYVDSDWINVQISSKEIYDYIYVKLRSLAIKELNARVKNFKEAEEDAKHAIQKYLSSDGDEKFMEPIAEVISDYLLNNTRNKGFAEIPRPRKRPNKNTDDTTRLTIRVSEVTNEMVFEILRSRMLPSLLQLSSSRGSTLVGNEATIQSMLTLLLVGSLEPSNLEGFDDIYKIIPQFDVEVQTYGRQKVDLYAFNTNHALFIELKYADNHSSNTIRAAFKQCLGYTSLFREYMLNYQTVSFMAIRVFNNATVEIWSTTKTKEQIEEFNLRLLEKISADISQYINTTHRTKKDATKSRETIRKIVLKPENRTETNKFLDDVSDPEEKTNLIKRVFYEPELDGLEESKRS